MKRSPKPYDECDCGHLRDEHDEKGICGAIDENENECPCRHFDWDEIENDQVEEPSA